MFEWLVELSGGIDWQWVDQVLPVISSVDAWLDEIAYSIYGLLSDIYNFLESLFKEIPYILGLLTSFAANIPGYFSWLPPGVSALLVTTFAIVVVYMIANRK